jgi:hypothetical protein
VVVAAEVEWEVHAVAEEDVAVAAEVVDDQT